ncbi:type IV pilin-like G/H family protein [Gloeothece citriformis]|uniref:type IV pilin-like G/H family protein n=1 Tax=Gloeothece citriformis TaxID=2546356 RepID=UPI000173C2CB|nr:type IV pilin-like G/H family protein [Gloeothece citriformis]
MGAVNRAQQAFRYEHGTFGTVCSNNLSTIGTWCNGSRGTLSVKLKPSQYYRYRDTTVPSSTSASYYADVPTSTPYDYELKDYSASVGLTSTGGFSGIICGAINPHPVGGMGLSTNGTTCGHNSEPVK